MPQFHAEDEDTPFVNCAVCENGIFGGRWFARIKHQNIMVALCCPLCVETFEANPAPYLRRIVSIDEMALKMAAKGEPN